MKFRTGFRLVVVSALLLLAACASAPRVSSQVDPSADFSRYRSFSFYTPLALEQNGYTTITSNRIRAAVRTQMQARGYVYDEANPDLWVNLNAYLQDKTRVTSMPEVDYDYYYSYRARGYVAVPYWRDRTDVHQYTEGTLNVDLVDVRRKQLVWEGVAVGTVGRSDAQRRGEQIDAAVAKIFEAYPYFAPGVAR
ncbi:DUF4136 domain-containing protein [Stenotrophomonas sp. SY1]|jgi:hypothetical protein|uniref:DUF4136 domain-containing protein n=1 Tax=Stenotrophomonas sp. SY1 TaxID=477235 RepID=UPI001E5AC586|nr:DUF4136 domain-containing protein [Stenotrophomonas sp. SY1]MCD9088074.1 DUF4136 domain-containing protein [Stenotrophomonas sp. SY1]